MEGLTIIKDVLVQGLTENSAGISHLLLVLYVKNVLSYVSMVKDLLLYLKDVLTEACADSVNLSSALASSTLNKKREDRVINPDLHKDMGPPWGRQELEEWVKTPVSPPKDFRGRPTIQPRVSVIQIRLSLPSTQTGLVQTGLEEWVKTLVSPPKDFRGRPTIQPRGVDKNSCLSIWFYTAIGKILCYKGQTGTRGLE